MLDQHRRAIALLVDCPDGCTTTLLYEKGIGPELIAELLTLGLATAEAKRKAGGKVDCVRVSITDAGRVALER